jgi:RecA/RadA recombinase
VKDQTTLVDTNARQRAIDAALSQMDKQFGKGSVLRLGSRNVLPVTVISSGSISVDNALGVGGFPRGRVIEIFGPESSGKTTMALQVIAQAQKAGGAAAFIDAEHALDASYARKLGVDVDNLIVSQPDYGEQALEIAGALIGSGGIDVVVVDSVAALVPKAELDGEMGDSHMGLHARLMSQALRKLTGTVARTNTLLVFINQVREKIGVAIFYRHGAVGHDSQFTHGASRAWTGGSRQRHQLRAIGDYLSHGREPVDGCMGMRIPCSCANSMASGYPASTCRITPIPGSVVSTRSSRRSAASVPSATTTIPACCA